MASDRQGDECKCEPVYRVVPPEVREAIRAAEAGGKEVAVEDGTVFADARCLLRDLLGLSSSGSDGENDRNASWEDGKIIDRLFAILPQLEAAVRASPAKALPTVLAAMRSVSAAGCEIAEHYRSFLLSTTREQRRLHADALVATVQSNLRVSPSVAVAVMLAAGRLGERG